MLKKRGERKAPRCERVALFPLVPLAGWRWSVLPLKKEKRKAAERRRLVRT